MSEREETATDRRQTIDTPARAPDAAPGRIAPTAALTAPQAPVASGIATATLAARADAAVARAEAQRQHADSALAQAARVVTRTPAPVPTPPPAFASPRPPAMPDKVQRLSRGTNDAATGAQAIAGAGIADGGSALPYADAIQRAFGAHDVSDVVAHVGGNAANACDQLDAHAYAAGDHVAFARAPDLHTAAHEAAHVVQQRHGATPENGVGTPGDAYERNADAVADRVVRGESAEALLPPATGARTTAVQRLYNTSPPSTAIDDTFVTPAQNPQLFQFVGQATKAVQTGALDAANEASTILRVTIALKKQAIDQAIAADRASGAKLDPGLETAVIQYKSESDLATSAADGIRGLRTQLAGISVEIGGIQDKHDADLKSETANEVSADQEAADTAAVHNAHRNAEIMGDLVIDNVAATVKGVMNPKEALGSMVDMLDTDARGVFHIWNDQKEQEETAAAKAQVKAKWDHIKASITKDNAAAISTQIEGLHGQITGIATQINAQKQALSTHLVASWQLAKTILKSKSPVTALAPIQAYLREVPVKADKLRSLLAKVKPMIGWDYWGIGNAAASQLAFTFDDKHPHAAQARQGMNEVEAWIANTQLWFAGVTAETSNQEAFLDGPLMEPAEGALMLIADLSGVPGK